jgi:Flp pilus assembly protein TadD
MKLFKNIAKHFLPGREVLLLIGLVMLCACASQQVANTTPPPLRSSEPVIRVADIDVLEVTPAMDKFLERYILKYANEDARLHLLVNATTGNGVIGFDYDEALTMTAAESFRARSGNCIGYANMMVALARRAGLKADYQVIFRTPEWSSRKATVLLIKQINVVIASGTKAYVVDISGIKYNQSMVQRLIGDNYAKALYLNNIGAEALLENKLPKAHAYLSKAIETESHMTDSWVNMGVVFGRNDQLDDAEMAFQRALKIDASEYSAMSNLYEVYLAQEDLESAENLQAKVDKYRQRNPYHLLQLSEEALEQARFEESLSLIKRAIRKKNDDHVLHFALAKTQYLSGELVEAEGSLIRARELAPASMIAQYDRPWDELVAKE